MLARARQTRDSYVAQALTWEDFMAKIGAGNLVLTPYCNEKAAGAGAPSPPMDSGPRRESRSPVAISGDRGGDARL